MKNLKDRELWAVYGVPQYKLKIFVSLAKLGKVQAGIVYTPPEPNGSVYVKGISLSNLEKDFIV